MEGIIRWQQSIDVSADDKTDEQGFFFRCTTAGNIKYCAIGNADADAITEAFDASTKFEEIFTRKIFASGTTATGIIIGKSH